jgi:hypothetical protein
MLRQGRNERAITANRVLSDFMSETRQKMFGFDPFPSDISEVEVNGEPAFGWDQFISDGDKVSIKIVGEENSIGPESVTSASNEVSVSRVAELETQISELNAQLTEARNSSPNNEELRIKLRDVVSDTNSLIEDVRDAQIDLHEALTGLDLVKIRFSEILSELNPNA